MKLDKDTIVKHHFWFLAGAAAVLALIGWVALILSAPSSVAVERKKVKTSWDAQKNQNEFQSPAAVKTRQKEAEDLKNQRSISHVNLYKSQDEAHVLMTWPAAMEREFDFKNGKFAVEIVVHPPKTKVNTLPKDDATHISGTLTGRTDKDWFELASPDKKIGVVKFLRTPTISNRFGELSGYKQEDNRVATVTFVVGKSFGDELTDSEKKLYREVYSDQLPSILDELAAVNILDQPVTLLRYAGREEKPAFPGAKVEAKASTADVVNDTWVFRKGALPPPDNRFFPFVAKWPDNPDDIFSEEVWAAQETLWVQRELFKRLKAANDELAICRPVEGRPMTFRNHYWEIELKAGGGGVTATLTNIGSQQQSVDDLRFLLRYKDVSDPVEFPPKGSAFESVPLNPKESFEAKKPFILAGAPTTPPDGVEQVLTVDTAAIKRIDVMSIGAASNGETAVSHRQYPVPLKPYPTKAAVKTDLAKDGAPPGKEPPPPPPPPISGKVDQPGKEQIKMSRRGVVMDRYLEVTSESRKLPINLVLIVGPEHIARVQAALISSPLRFLETQVVWQRHQLPLGGPDASAGGGGPPGGGSLGQENVELIIYGMATLYQRPGK